MARFFKPETIAFVVALVAMLLVFRERGLSDPGTLWHTRVGLMILDSGFMTTDPFTFPFEGKTWIPQQWLGEVLMAGLHALGNWDAMLVAYSALFAAALAVIVKRLMAGGVGWPLTAIVAGLAGIAMGFHFYLRPHVFTIVFMVLTTIILCDVDAKRKTWKYLFWLIPLHLVWTNIHGGMLGGIAIFTIAIACWTIERVVSRAASASDRTLAHLSCAILILLVCTLTMFVNPIGLELQRTWFRLIGSKTLAEFVPEHSPLNLARGGDQAVMGFAILYLVILLAAGKPRLLWLMPLVWLILTLQSIRNGPLFVATASVMLADIWPHTFWHRLFLIRGDTLAKPPYPPVIDWRAWILPAILVLVLLLTLRGWARFSPRYVPMDMIDAVRVIPPGERIYNDPNFGGFLIWHAPGHRIFMDDRFELCGDDWLRNYVERPAFDVWQKQYGFRYAFIAPDSLPLGSDWHLIHRGRIAALYKLR